MRLEQDAGCETCDDRVAIERLMVEYCRRIDAGDLHGFAELFRHGSWLGNAGYEQTLDWLRNNIILYDGSPMTQHLMSAVTIDVDRQNERATARCYITVLQQVPGDSTISVIAANTYRDAFARRHGSWHFAQRRIIRMLRGDTSKHRR